MILSAEFLQTLDKISMVVKRTRNRQLAGKKPSVHVGSGLEFHDYIPYQPGDDYRYVDWSLYARLGQLFLKTFTEEHDTNIHFLVDSSSSMNQPKAKLTMAAQLAGALGYISLRQLDAVGAAFTTDTVVKSLAPKKGRSQILHLLRFLDQDTAVGQTNLAQVLGDFAWSHKRPGIVVVISDFFDDSDYFQALRRLMGSGWQVILVQVLSPDELNPTWSQPIVVVDSETGQQIPLDPNGLAAKYTERLQEFQARLASLVPLGIHYVPVSTEVSLEQVIFQALRAQGVVQ